MRRKENFRPAINRRQFWYAITPLLFLLGAIVFINLLTEDAAGSRPVDNLPTPVASGTMNPPTATARLPILPATILPSPTPSLTPRPEIQPEATIMILGPPPDSSMVGNGRIAFLWTYSEPLLPGQQLLFSLRQDGFLLAKRILSKPSFGTVYQISLDFGQIAAEGTADWQVQLIWEETEEPLLSSEVRRLTLLSPLSIFHKIRFYESGERV